MKSVTRNTVLLGLLLIIVCLPRFDRNDLFLGGIVGAGAINDSVHYVAMTEIYKNNESEFSPQSPFTYRPFVPFLASLLPLSSMTGINVINIISLIAGMVLLGKLLIGLGATEVQRVTILTLYTLSFPVFYYGAIGYVDPVAVSFLAIGSYLIYRQLDFALIVTLFLGALAKETVILLVPVFLVYAVLNRQNHLRSLIVFLGCLAGYFAGMTFARETSIDPTSEFWAPSMDRFLGNITRFRTWASLVLALGIAGFLALFAVITILIYRRWRVFLALLPWLTGMLGSFALYFMSILTAYSDGRFIWPASVFALPILLISWQHFSGNSEYTVRPLENGVTPPPENTAKDY